ncbi:IclR family transcriptional regulator [Peribacillus simplex]|uniref:IclR family transcriptional regulator n=1 Tax=Peribacillus simplex TaxID=1478 RepID=A0AAW7IIL4_9BACI|nr:IclR family transcriptional regulator [Peribacillus simplex]AMM92895.1 IclR family transcriptional regulator [Peribacillus simplex]MDM5294955.1 IclR family transcriptional regulator [Peribacillus simplex]MDM5453915.1 IclR family transcriptional regulator [Peribacillus simplex]
MISSVEKVIKILDLFTNEEPSLGNKEIAEKLNMSPSSSHHLVKTMCKEGMLIQGKDRKYRLGWKLLEWSSKVMYQQDIHYEAGPILSNLVLQFRGNSHIGMFHEGEVRFVMKMSSPHAEHMTTFIGARKPAYCTSSGKILLAFNPSFIQPTLAKGLLKHSTNTITCINQLDEELKAIRKQGFAISDDENDFGLYGVAAPIKSYNGQVIAALNLVGDRNYMIGREKTNIIQSVIRSAQMISKQVGYMSLV